MKRFPMALFLLMTFLSILVIYPPAHAVTDKVTLHIEGMTWASWPVAVKKALDGLEGVEKVSISFKAKRAEVFFDPNKANETEMVNRVNQIGFKAKVVE